jgi:hypothetical protein
MNRKSKALTLVLLAALALAAVLASPAAAANYTASGYPETMRSSSPGWNVTWITEGGTVECAEELEGTLSAASNSLTVKPTYWGCSAFGFLEAKAATNGCDYLFREPTGSIDFYSAKLDITCPSGKVIEFTTSTCKVTIGAQTGLSKISITNNTGFSDVSLDAEVQGVAYTVVTDGFLCPFNGTGAKTGAKYLHDAPVSFAPIFGKKFDVG